MEVWASIDLLDGRVVRLVKGDVSSTIVYPGSPLHFARRFSELGFDGIHIVDLDAALGYGDNVETIEDIVRSVNVRVQVGGGIRSVEKAEYMLGLGVSRVVIGTMIFKDCSSVARLVTQHGSERFVAALDHYRGRIVYEGWRASSGMSISEGYQLVRELGIRYVLITSVERDGTLTGLDTTIISNLSQDERCMTYASGGISSPSEVSELTRLKLKGVILGRALYEGLIPPSEFIRAARE